MANESQLLNIDTIVIDGAAIAFEDSTAQLTGAARFENTAVPSAKGDDFTSRKRVPCVLSCKLQFNNQVDPADYAKIVQAQITGRDSVTKRRVILPRCSFGSMGAVGGGGSVDVSFVVLSAPQWL